MNLPTAEITYADVRESVAVARSHGEKFFEQIVWQVENHAWTVLGYSSWDEMREAEYADLGVKVPSADRPELASRLRAKGLTQKSIADTLGVSQRQVSTDLNSRTSNEDQPPTITNSRGQQRPASYAPRPEPDPEPETFTIQHGADWVGPGEEIPVDAETVIDRDTGEILDERPIEKPRQPNRRPLPDVIRDLGLDLDKHAGRINKLADDDRLGKHKEEAKARLGLSLSLVIEACQRLNESISN